MKVEDLAKLDKNKNEEEMLKAEMEGTDPEMIRDPFSEDKVIQDLRDVEQGNLEPELKKQLETENKKAESPFQQNKEERTKDFVENPMMTLQEKYKALVDDYEKEQKKELKQPGVMDALPDILAGLYNIGVRANPTGLRELNLPSNIERIQKQAQEQKDRRLQNIDKTRSMLKDLMALQVQQEKTQGLTPYQRETLDLKKQELDLKKNKPKSEKEKLNLTEGQKKLDQEFAKTYEQFRASGGGASLSKNLNALEGVVDRLKQKDDITGTFREKYVPFEGMRDYLRSGFDEEAQDLKDTVEQVIQQSLRQTLGAQFTEKEAQRLIERSYNPKLSDEKNIERLNATIKELRERADSKMKASKYFEEKGTLQGFKPKNKTAEKISKPKVQVVLPDGRQGRIDADKIEAFRKKYPKAKIME